MKKLIAICAAIVLFRANFITAGTWTTLNFPGSENMTHINGIDGNNIYGFCSAGGFIYDGTNWTTINMPNVGLTEVRGISGNNVIGEYNVKTGPFPIYVGHGCLYNGSTWITIDKPGAFETQVSGIDGSNIVGTYDNHGFLFDGTNWQTIDHPGAQRTAVYGIKGNILFGRYDHHGFFYNIDTQVWTTFDAPGATFTSIYGIDGSNIIGKFSVNGNTTSFFYDGTTWFTDLPGWDAEGSPAGINGDTIVGTYYTYYEEGNLIAHFSHGYVYTIPEPASAMMIAIGSLFIGLRKKRI